jgi:hypothetical protein
MNFRGTMRYGLFALGLAALGACAAPTQLTSDWADPNQAGQSYKKIVVVGVTPKAAGRRAYEDAFVSELRSAPTACWSRV